MMVLQIQTSARRKERAGKTHLLSPRRFAEPKSPSFMTSHPLSSRSLMSMLSGLMSLIGRRELKTRAEICRNVTGELHPSNAQTAEQES